MILFGKTLSEYVSFQKYLLLLTVAVGIVRFGVSLSGMGDVLPRVVSLTALVMLSALYYPIRVHSTGFGGFRHVWVLLVIQLVIAESISAAGIGIAALTGVPNAFSTVGPDANYLSHALVHLLGGPTVFGLVLWGVASVVLVVARRVAPGPVS